MSLTVRFYKNDNGKEPVRDWLKKLSPEDRKTIGEDIKTVQFGWPVGMPVVRSVSGYKKMWEVRSDLKDGISRILFTIQDDEMILLHGFIKKTQKTEKKELDLAKARMT